MYTIFLCLFLLKSKLGPGALDGKVAFYSKRTVEETSFGSIFLEHANWRASSPSVDRRVRGTCSSRREIHTEGSQVKREWEGEPRIVR